jgi:hypothetical protein
VDVVVEEDEEEVERVLTTVILLSTGRKITRSTRMSCGSLKDL